MATKTIVTKERLAYYDQKIKAEIAKKGDIKSIKLSGEAALTPDENGMLTIPGYVVKGMKDPDYNGAKMSYTYDESGVETTKTINFYADGNDHTLLHIVNDSDDNVIPMKTYVDNKAAALSGSKFQKVDAIPEAATATDGVIYLVPNSSSGNNVFDEYFRVNLGTDSEPNYAMEKVGSTAIDLSGYVEETDLVEITTAEIDEFFTSAVTP